MARFDDKIEQQITRHVIDNEYNVEMSNSSEEFDDFEAAIELFENERVERDYDWMSDIPLPEFAAQMLTQTSIDVSQYFQTRDFVETYIQDPSDEALLAADAAEECINRTLNRRDLYHYQKFVRAKTMNNIGGSVIAHCWWEKDKGKGKFDYEVLDPRNVIMSREYAYSLQQKEWVQIRYERTLPELKAEKSEHKYFDLDKLKDIDTGGDTETKQKTRDQDSGYKKAPKRLYEGPFDIVKRFGQFWVKDGEPGIDEDGNVMDGATLQEMVIIVAIAKGRKFLIGFHKQPYKDAFGNPIRPILRGICYIHPTRDRGLGDGHFARPIQNAINDTFNLSNDRVRLATMPTMQGKKYVTEDADDIFFQPEHIMSVNEIGDIQEFKVDDNIEGAMIQLGILTKKMQQTTSIYPPTMGEAEQSETATAIATGERHTNQRTNYKSLTFEYTFLNELYWMILQMTWQFASAQDAMELMGEKVVDFNPTYDYYYKPLSQSIETDQSKTIKVQHWTTVLGYVANMTHPSAPALFNYIISKIAVLMGDEYANIGDKILDEDQPMEPGETPEGAGTPQGPSNQYGVGMQGPEVATRIGANIG
jgi:hypothetical protein